MKSFLKGVLNIFRKKKIRYLGLTGLIYSDGSSSYFVGSELLSSKDFDIEVYKDEVYKIENENKLLLSQSQATIMLEVVIKELEKTGMRVYTK